MRVIISAGGTGGHIYPALAIINKIKEREPDSEFLYIGTHNRMEKDIIPNYGIPFESIEIYGINRKNIFKNFKTIQCFYRAIKKCKKIMKDFKPDVVVGVGGYVTGAVIYSAKRLGYPTFIHEQNSVPGKANLFLSKYADKIGVSFKSTLKEFPEYKTIYTGNPCSEEAIRKEMVPKSMYHLSSHKKLVLIVMGSLGSEKITNMMLKTLDLFKNKNYEVIFVTGKNSYETFEKVVLPSNVKVVPYIENLSGFMKNVDVIVSRAGASTMSELIALQIPSILVPSPYVPNNHQYKNAIDLVNKKAALLIEEKDLSGKLLVSKIDELLDNQEEYQVMKENLKKMAILDSAERIYRILKELSENENR